MISVKKQALTVSAALAAFALTFGAPVLGHAAYQLNPEVKDATPALKEASAIGVRTHNTEALQNLPNKDAMVVMSFGTTYKDTRAKTKKVLLTQLLKKHWLNLKKTVTLALH